MIRRASSPAAFSPSLWLSVALVVAGLTGAGCDREETGGPPVAAPSVTLHQNRVALGSPVRITYRFEVAQDARFDGDYIVFVHVLDPEGERLWDDDHRPPIPTSQWKPGQTVEYTRTSFVPNYPYIGEVTMRLGLYQGDQRLVLSGAEATRREYVVAKFQLLPQSENIYLIYGDGWHPAEVSADNPAAEWQWTQQRAVFRFKNPKRNATFYLEYDARVDLFNPPQQVTVKVGDQPIGTFVADAREKKLMTFPISAGQLGDAEVVVMAIEVDRTFKPGGGDTRDLGIRVFHTFIEPAE